MFFSLSVRLKQSRKLVLHDRAAEREAKLVPRVVVVLLQVERPFIAKGGIAEETEDGAVRDVRPRLGDDRDRSTGRTADLGVETVGDDAELLDSVLAEAHSRQTVESKSSCRRSSPARRCHPRRTGPVTNGSRRVSLHAGVMKARRKSRSATGSDRSLRNDARRGVGLCRRSAAVDGDGFAG
jgi:hypothetical protein